MPQDSMSKIAETYFAAICREPFTFKGKTYVPKDLICSPLLFRGYTCPSGCGGCCKNYTLDYLEKEYSSLSIKRSEIEERTVDISGKKFQVWSDMNDDHGDYYCRNIDKSNGRCKVHGEHAFSCDFELIRFIHQKDRIYLTSRLFGRGWAMLRVDNERGSMCEMLPATKETTDDVTRKLKRLKEWVDYFGIVHCLDSIIKWSEEGDHTKPLFIKKDSKTATVIKNLLVDVPEEPPDLVQIG